MAADRLEKYRAKRDFTKTAEPSGKKRGGKVGNNYLIQKHDASREHYDFRLEHDGTLLSWAIPKGPSLDPADKRLAVHVEDHPVDYGDFEGTIPKDQYGGGTVMLWDRGNWAPMDDVEEGLAKGNFKFVLNGARLQGGFALIRLKPRGREDRGKDNWLLIKERDPYVRIGQKPITETETTSVKTGRTMEQIARGDDVWQSKPRAEKSADKSKTSKAKTGSKKKSSGALKLPEFVEPQLATLVDKPPEGAEWFHEIKLDGYRAVTSLAGGAVKIRTRTGLDWTDKFSSLVKALSELPCDAALLDGEIAVADKDGRTDFGALQDALSKGSGGLVYYLFDLLSLDGKDLRREPLRNRKARLQELLADAGPPLILSEHFEGNGADIFAQAGKLGLEGIISKNAERPYSSGRTKSWLKVKCVMEQEFIIIGWQPSKKAGRPFSSLLLAVRDEGELRYCGRVGSGYSDTRLDDLAAKFKQHARKISAVEGIPREIARDARYLEPVLVAEIAFRGWTHDGVVRQASFKGLRADKPARAVVKEEPMPTQQAVKGKSKSTGRVAKPAAKKSSAATSSAAASGGGKESIADVRVTHPDRVLYDQGKVTKRDLIDYYLKVADLILPHIAGRPLALVRCPDGVNGERFFQKHASKGWPEFFHEVRIKEKSGSDQYLYINDERGLVAAAQMSVLEIHIWGSKVPEVEEPERLVFDLDPDEGLDFGKVKEAAVDLRQRLGEIGLKSFPMVTGGKGVHVVVPLKRGHTWEQHRDFAEALARVMAEEDSSRYVANMSKAKRRGRIFIDYLRNQRGSTAIAPYSTRAREGATVAFPISWEGLARLKDAAPMGVGDVGRIVRTGDPWQGYFKLRQKLPLGK